MKRWIALFVFLISVGASAQVTFEAKVSKKKLGVNERLRIDFVMNRDGDNFIPPGFENFTVVGGPSQSINNSWINGKHTFSKTYSYFLSPDKRGTFTIGQAVIEIEGQIYKTSPVQVTVTAAVEVPADPNDPNYIAAKNIHLVAEVSNTNPYLNEAIAIEYKLYVSLNTGVENWREKDIPRYNDFWSQNIEIKGLKVENGKFNGEDYRYIVLRKTVLYPQTTGKLEIEPLTLDIDVQVPTSKTDFFGRRIMRTVSKTVTAGKRTIDVKPLPEEGRPLNFSGAVGEFSFNVTTSKDELQATEAFQTTVEVEGKGNLKLFNLPELSLPSSLEVYEPEHSVNVRTRLSGMEGRITDSYTVVPSYQGKYPIPSISFSYFDLKTERYETINSEELIINVLGGPTDAEAQPPVVMGSQKNPVISAGEQFLSFKTQTTLRPIESRDFFKSNWFWTSLLAPFLAIPLAILIRNRNEARQRDVVGSKKRKADKLARKYLGEAKRALGDKVLFYEALERALHNYLKARLYIETSEFSKEHIARLLVEKQVQTADSDNFIALLSNCELARYTPYSNVEMERDYKQAADTIAAIDKQMKS